VASLEMQGLTGVAFIEISGGSQSAPPLAVQAGQRHPVITSQQSSLQRLAATAPEALARLVDVADRLASLMGDQNRAAISETLENVRRLTAVAAGRAGDIDSAIGDAAATMRDLHATATAAHQAVEELSQLIGKDGQATETLKSAQDASRKLDALAGELDAMVKENRQPIQDFSRRGLAQMSQVLSDARTLIGELTRLTDQLERDPSRLLFGNQQRGYQPR
jgi:phospholipid/cholesterol/gamma-HCH transport system substrate-binding protein